MKRGPTGHFVPISTVGEMARAFVPALCYRPIRRFNSTIRSMIAGLKGLLVRQTRTPYRVKTLFFVSPLAGFGRSALFYAHYGNINEKGTRR